MVHHLTAEERDRIAQLRHQGADQNEVARALSRSPGTIRRQLRRNGSGSDYFAAQAHERAQRRRQERPLTRKRDRPELNQAVRGGLTQDWSPEQIAGRLQLEDPPGQTSCDRPDDLPLDPA